jgi:biopolymer transport protein ExbD
MKMAVTVRIGACFVLGGIALFGSAVHWLAPRPLVALRLPVSLSPGHIVTGPFTVQRNSLNYVDVELDSQSSVPARCAPRSVLATEWVLHSDGKEERGGGPWEDPGLTLAVFTSEQARYSLDMEVLPGASCLNARNPRLKVQTHPYSSNLYLDLTWLSIVPVCFGLTLLFFPYIARTQVKSDGLRIFPDMPLRNVLPLTKHKPLALIHSLPHWGLVQFQVLWILILTFMIFGPTPSKGIRVSWREHNAIEWEKNPWPDTLEVYVASPARFYINGKEVRRFDLRSKLLEELSRRPEWTVYFEADYDTSFGDDVYAIDTIQACGANLIWITPKMREKWQSRSRGDGS